MARGVDADDVAAALAALPPERERAAALADRHGPGRRTVALLLRRGFDPDSAEAAGGPEDVAPEGP